MSVQDHRRKADLLLAQYTQATTTVEREQMGLDNARQKEQNCEQAQQVLQQVAEAVQNIAHAKIAGVVTRCLKAVFGDSAYEFQIIFERKRGKTEARLAFVRDGIEHDPTSSCGGGTVDVAAFALRLACLLLSRPRLRRVLILDEPFRYLSSSYREAVCAMLLEVSKELGVQIIQVTHSPELLAGKIIQL